MFIVNWNNTELKYRSLKESLSTAIKLYANFHTDVDVVSELTGEVLLSMCDGDVYVADVIKMCI